MRSHLLSCAALMIAFHGVSLSTRTSLQRTPAAPPLLDYSQILLGGAFGLLGEFLRRDVIRRYEIAVDLDLEIRRRVKPVIRAPLDFAKAIAPGSTWPTGWSRPWARECACT